MAGNHNQRKLEMRRLRYGDGWTLQRIADRYGISRERVRQILGNTGSIASRRTDRLRDDEFLIQTAHLSNKELADLLGLTERTVALHRPKKLLKSLVN
jgi:DNA-binding CsgD family transcriptional regulator